MTMSDQDIAVTPLEPTPALFAEKVLWVRHWNEHLFSFAITRPPSFRFRSGEFVMIGLPDEKKPLLRAYSIASPAWSEELEFLSIKVQDGPLTSRLQKIQPGDYIYLGRKPTGTLVADAVIPGRRLFLLGTGTGLAPFMSIIRDPDIYEMFDSVIVVHGTRRVSDLAYRDELEGKLAGDPLVEEQAAEKLIYLPSVTREDFPLQVRITTLLSENRLLAAAGIADELHPDTDRFMLCGSMDMIKDTAHILDRLGFEEGSNATPGTYVLERAFVG
jgi:ferredoxin--NADP+ reductase